MTFKYEFCIAILSELMKIVKDESKRMIDAQPSEAAIGNMVRRGWLG